MADDGRWTRTEQDEDAYEDAWYRALKAKAEHRFPDPVEDAKDAFPAAPTPDHPSLDQAD